MWFAVQVRLRELYRAGHDFFCRHKYPASSVHQASPRRHGAAVLCGCASAIPLDTPYQCQFSLDEAMHLGDEIKNININSITNIACIGGTFIF